MLNVQYYNLLKIITVLIRSIKLKMLYKSFVNQLYGGAKIYGQEQENLK